MNEESSDEKEYYNFADERDQGQEEQEQEQGQGQGQDSELATDRSMSSSQHDDSLTHIRLQELVQQRVEASKTLRLNLITIVNQINVLSLAFVDDVMEVIEAKHADAALVENHVFIEIEAAQEATRSVLKVNEWLTSISAEISTNLLNKSGAGQHHQNQHTQAHSQAQAMTHQQQQPQPQQLQQLRDNRGLGYNNGINNNGINNNIHTPSEYADQENRFHNSSNNSSVNSNGNGEHMNHNHVKPQPMKSDPKNEMTTSSSSSTSSFFFQDNQGESQSHSIFVNSIGKM